ncbi:MAG: outer membrane beta-barrel protein [Vicinamibacterales bacterium]
MMSRLVVGMCFAALVAAAPASAQTSSAPASGSSFGGRIFLDVEGQAMTAKKSFDAVTGSSTMKGFGGGLEVQGLWSGLFLRGALSRLSASGERVFVFENQVFPLGVSVDITMTPLEAAAGWRFTPFSSRAIVPYVGGGALFLKYREDSEGDVSGESVNETYNGVVVFGGIEIPVWQKMSAGAELGWRKAKVKSPGGALQAFGENDLGGVTVRVMLSFRK